MFRAVSIIGLLLVVYGALTFGSKKEFSGLAGINVGIFLLVVGGLVEGFIRPGKKNGKE